MPDNPHAAMICSRCNLDKPENEFPIKRATGQRSIYCRACTTRMNTLSWAKRNPEKKSAHYYVAKALKDGKITRPNVCSWCGAEGYVIAHHRSYRRVLDIEWVCDRCHKNHHVAENGKKGGRPKRRKKIK